MSRHRSRTLLAGVLLGLTALAPQAVHAQVLYDNGVPDQVNGYTVSPPFAVADRFTLGSDANVGSFSWYALHLGNTATIVGNYSWNIFTDAAGAPGSVLFSGAVAAQTGTLAPYTVGGYSAYLFNTAVGSLPLSAGSYWLGIGNFSSSTGAEIGYWAESHAQGSAYQSFDNGATYNAIGVGMAFSISGKDAVVTPEPATLALLGTGLLGMWGVTVRRRVRG